MHHGKRRRVTLRVALSCQPPTAYKAMTAKLAHTAPKKRLSLAWHCLGEQAAGAPRWPPSLRSLVPFSDSVTPMVTAE